MRGEKTIRIKLRYQSYQENNVLSLLLETKRSSSVILIIIISEIDVNTFTKHFFLSYVCFQLTKEHVIFCVAVQVTDDKELHLKTI